MSKATVLAGIIHPPIHLSIARARLSMMNDLMNHKFVLGKRILSLQSDDEARTVFITSPKRSRRSCKVINEIGNDTQRLLTMASTCSSLATAFNRPSYRKIDPRDYVEEELKRATASDRFREIEKNRYRRGECRSLPIFQMRKFSRRLD